VVVHVHSLGVEQITLYRAEVLGARAAAAAGFPVFRHHARGHGDSTGDFADVTLEGLVEDALAAAAEAQRRSGAAEVIWLGARFGAIVAALAAARHGDSPGIALWEPVHRPLDYFRAQLRGMLFSQVAAGKRPDATVDQLLERCERDGHVDVHGYLLHQALIASTRDAELGAALAPHRGALLLAQIQARPRLSAPNAALAANVESRGQRVTTRCITEEPGWQFMLNPAWESADLSRAMQEWLDAVG
jgi:pimeloyl-ACP methyl ester carboxylesterase